MNMWIVQMEVMSQPGSVVCTHTFLKHLSILPQNGDMKFLSGKMDMLSAHFLKASLDVDL